MSNASLKDQLEAVASQITGKARPEEQKTARVEKKFHPANASPPGRVKKPKPVWLDYVQYGVELLKVYFPDCFTSPGKNKPLKKGIKHDLVKRLSTLETIATDDKACMVKSLSYYVNTLGYLKNVLAGAPRVDLDGLSNEIVTAEEAKYSLERQQAKHDAKKAGGKPQVAASKELAEVT